MRRFKDQLGEKDLVLAFVNLEIMIRKSRGCKITDRLQEIYTSLTQT